MTTQDSKRKLTAILSADVKSYSRLMSQDEEATVKTLKQHRVTISGLVSAHRGRVVDSPGDNILAEFGSVVDAVKCAVKIQETLKGKNAELPENRRMEFRIGVNLGDVIEEEDRIYGDGVNIAARLEGLADAGGICISGTAFDHVKNKVSVGYQYLGKQTVKNIPDPVRAYKVLMEPEAAGKVIGEKEPKQTRWGWKAVAAVAVLVLVSGGLVWNFYWRSPKIEPASKDRMALPLPDKPSIAVLPFVNMTGDPGQEFFCDGVSEDIITALSKVPRLLVIARNSTFTYKGKPVKVKQVSEELGVQYVLEGSVQKSADRIRITAQLIDALKGHHIWADHYDRELKDLFALQDEITVKIITALQVKLTAGETAQLVGKSTKNLQAYLKVLEARESFYTITKEGFAQTRRLSEEAIALDPGYAAAYLYLGSAHFMEVTVGSSKDPEESLKLAFEMTKKAIALDDSESTAHSILGFLYVMTKQYDQGIAECERAVALAPNSSTTNIWMGLVLLYAGRHEEAVRYAEQALRLDPMPVGWYFRALGQAYAWVGRYEEAIGAHKKALQRAPNDIVTYLALTTAYSWAGRLEEARAQALEVLRINPNFSLDQQAKRSPYKNRADGDRVIDGLRKAGLPDKPPLPLPDKPSIAVLPFVNMSEDKSQEFFSDGLTEEIITALSKTPKLFVIARNSTFVYKGKPVNVQQVSRELGVKYVLEGSVRRSGDQLRITAQLIDATTGNHLWAERYDREMKDVFAIQDNITLEIMKALDVKLSRGEKQGRSTGNLEAYFKILQVSDFLYQFNRESNMQARKLAEEAISLDPQFAGAYYGLAAITMMDVMLGISKSPKDSRMKAIELCQKATSLDDTLAGAYGLLGYLYVQIGEYEKGIEAGERAIEVGPSSADAHSMLAQVLNFSGRAQEAISLNEKAFRLNPVGPTTYYYTHASFSYILTGRYEDAVKITRQELLRSPNNVLAYARLVWALSALGRDEESSAAAQNLLRIDPKFSAKRLTSSLTFKDSSVAPRYLEHMLKAGLPE
jgi:adenylate cyclase